MDQLVEELVFKLDFVTAVKLLKKKGGEAGGGGRKGTVWPLT